MSMLGRLASNLSAKANALLDRLDDPVAAIEMAQQDLSDELARLQRSGSLLDEARQELLCSAAELKGCASQLEAEARALMTSGNIDLAREALARRFVLRRGIDSLGTEESELTDEQEQFHDAATLSETALPILRAQIEAAKARFTASDDKAEINHALVSLEKDRAAVAAASQRAKDRARQLRAQARRIDALLTSRAIRDLTRSPVPIAQEVALARHSVEVDRDVAAIERDLT